MYLKAIFLVIILIYTIVIVHVKIRSGAKYRYSNLKDFMENEIDNTIYRKKEIPESFYLKINLDKFPFDKNTQKANIARFQNEVMAYSEKDIIKLDKPMKNNEIKLSFGVANFETVVNGEENLYQLVFAMVNWAEALKNIGKYEEAVIILAEVINLGVDISKPYTILADIRKEQKNLEAWNI